MFARELIERPRLLARLDQPSGLILVRAPAGFGKTILVRQWLDRHHDLEGATAAVRVRPGEGDPDSFWVSVIEALTDAGLPAPALVHSRSPQSSAARMISAGGRRLTLWVDGFENVGTSTAGRVLADLAADVAGLRVVISSRGHHHFPPHLLGEIEATTVSADELAFTAEETAQMLRVAGLDVSPARVEEIHAGLGGWPEPTRAVALALRSDPRAEPDVAATLDRVVPVWLHGRLLSDVTSPELLDAALVTALPDEITPELAELLTGGPSASADLASLVADGVLPSWRHDGEPVYRWPQSVRRALVAQLRREAPERVAELNERLARWYVDEGRPGSALRHAVEASAWELVASIVNRSWRHLILRHPAELTEALLSMPPEVAARGPRVTPARAIRSMFLGTRDDAVGVAALPESPEALAALGQSDAAAETLSTGLAVLIALRRPRLVRDAVAFSERLVRVAEAAHATRPGEVSDLRPSVHCYAGDVRLAQGRVGAAVPYLEEAYRSSADSPFGYLESDAAAKLALAHAVSGDLPSASAWLHRHDTAPQPIAWLTPHIRATAEIARVVVLVDRLELGAATQAAAALLGEALPDVRWSHRIYARALLALHTGTAATVLEELDHARNGHQGQLPAADEPLVAAAEADLLMALGQGNQARAVLHGPLRDHPRLRVGQARLALLAGDAATALRTATDAGWERLADNRQRQEMLLIRAVAAHRLDEAYTADAALHQAAAAALATGTLRPFTTVPRDDLTAVAARVPTAYDVLGRAPVASVREVFPAHLTLIELTRREQQVLEHIAAGYSVRQIAMVLHISYSTVRTQQRSLYRKLDVTSQADAVARGRQTGLLTSPATSA